MGKKILLADDSVTIQKVVELTFMDEDYEVDTVGSGDEAVAKLGSELPDLVVADVHMPGADGYEVCRQAKSLRAGLPVLLLVGTFEPFDEGEAEAAGADGYLKKPFDSQELLRRVEDLLASVPESRAEELEAETAETTSFVPEQIETELPAELPEDELPDLPPIDAAPIDAAPMEVEPIEVEPVAEVSEVEPDLEPDTPATFEAEVAPVEMDEVAEPVAAVAAPTDEAPSEPAAPSNGGGLSEADVDRIARRVAELVGEGVLRDVAWEVIPDLAEIVIKDRIRELEHELE